jgi:hypothetical protein
MKNYNGIKKIAVKAGTNDGEIYKTLLEKSTSTKKALIEPGLSAYLMDDGTTVEIYGSGFSYPDYLFSNGNTVVSFKVDDIENIVRTLVQKGATLLGNIEHVCTSYKFCHLLTKDNTVMGLYELAPVSAIDPLPVL